MISEQLNIQMKKQNQKQTNESALTIILSYTHTQVNFEWMIDLNTKSQMLSYLDKKYMRNIFTNLQ